MDRRMNVDGWINDAINEWIVDRWMNE